MLEPNQRRLLLEALRPPVGYQLDRAIGTTFGLDHQALLFAPLAFTFFRWEDAGCDPTRDPLALLEALRRHAENLSIFCQAGYISVPQMRQPLHAALEGSVVEVTAPIRDGRFHPKMWALRFVGGNTGTSSLVRYRLLVMSRNLKGFAEVHDVIPDSSPGPTARFRVRGGGPGPLGYGQGRRSLSKAISLEPDDGMGSMFL